MLGTAMKYEIAEVVDSEYDVVAKVSKDALSQNRQALNGRRQRQ